MSDTADWVATTDRNGFKVTYSIDKISISVVVENAEEIENARRSILLGYSAIQEGLAKKQSHSKVELPPISISNQ